MAQCVSDNANLPSNEIWSGNEKNCEATVKKNWNETKPLRVHRAKAFSF